MYHVGCVMCVVLCMMFDAFCIFMMYDVWHRTCLGHLYRYHTISYRVLLARCAFFGIFSTNELEYHFWGFSLQWESPKIILHFFADNYPTETHIHAHAYFMIVFIIISLQFVFLCYFLKAALRHFLRRRGTRTQTHWRGITSPYTFQAHSRIHSFYIILAP